MRLKELIIKGLQCYNDSGKIPFHNLTVFIGENDAGKSTVFDALDFLLNNKMPRYSENEAESDFKLRLSLVSAESITESMISS